MFQEQELIHVVTRVHETLLSPLGRELLDRMGFYSRTDESGYVHLWTDRRRALNINLASLQHLPISTAEAEVLAPMDGKDMPIVSLFQFLLIDVSPAVLAHIDLQANYSGSTTVISPLGGWAVRAARDSYLHKSHKSIFEDWNGAAFLAEAA